MPGKWVSWDQFRRLSARQPDNRTHYEKTVDNKHNKGRPRDRIGRFEDRPSEDERADDRDEQDNPDREDDR